MSSALTTLDPAQRTSLPAGQAGGYHGLSSLEAGLVSQPPGLYPISLLAMLYEVERPVDKFLAPAERQEAASTSRASEMLLELCD